MRTKFITSAPSIEGFPQTERPEFAFVGRSNVGKSSLLNRLAATKIARTSKQPGRTQLVNFFEVDGQGLSIMLADLPGYGFAKVPKAVRLGWTGLIESYLSERVPLHTVLMLIDVRRDPNEEDRSIFSWLTTAAPADVLLIGTKADKITKSKKKPTIQRLAKLMGAPPSAVHLTSASTGEGVEALKTLLRTRTAR